MSPLLSFKLLSGSCSTPQSPSPSSRCLLSSGTLSLPRACLQPRASVQRAQLEGDRRQVWSALAARPAVGVNVPSSWPRAGVLGGESGPIDRGEL